MTMRTVHRALFALVIFIGTTGGVPAQEAFSLGVVLGLSGTGATYSRDAVDAIQLAVDEINAGGGLLGKHPIELHVRDTETRADVAVEVLTDLIRRNQVRAVIGTYSSAAALAIKSVCRDNKVLHIATVSNSEDITKLDPSPYTFSVVPNTYMMSRAAVIGAVRLARQNGWKTYATIASDYAWGRSSQEIQVELFKQLAPELRLVAAVWPRLGQTRFNSFTVALSNADPDFIVSSVAGEDNVYWLRDAWEYRLMKTAPVVGGLISVTELLADDGSLRRGMYARLRAPFFAHLDVPAMVSFVARYRERFGRYPSDWAVMSYDGVHALRQGAELADSIDIERIRAALTATTIDTTRGRLQFRAIDNQLSASAYFGRIADTPDYPFPVYVDLVELKGPDIWRPEAEILRARTSALSR